MVSTEALILLLQTSSQEIMQGRVQNKWDKWSKSSKMYTILFFQRVCNQIRLSE